MNNIGAQKDSYGVGAALMQSIANRIPTTTIQSIERKVTRIARTRSQHLPPSPLAAAEAFQECATIVLSNPNRKLIQLVRPLRDAFVAQVAYSGTTGAEALLNHLLAEGPSVKTSAMIDLSTVNQAGGQLIGYLGGMAFNLIRDSSKKERRHQEIIEANDKLVLVYGNQRSARRIVRTSKASGDPEAAGDDKSRDYGVPDPRLEAVGMPNRAKILDRALTDELPRIVQRYGIDAARSFLYLCESHFLNGVNVNAALKQLINMGYVSMAEMPRMSIYRAIDRVEAKIKGLLSE